MQQHNCVLHAYTSHRRYGYSPVFQTLTLFEKGKFRPIQAQSILSLSEKHSLTVYDAIYLELAMKRGLPLATLDADLRKAASAENVRLL